ncbi:MAG: thioredoxin family protein [Fimbriimonadaceae bacterium]|nr:thioredoxin family protein [Fimbriimonadaceae bacterium]
MKSIRFYALIAGLIAVSAAAFAWQAQGGQGLGQERKEQKAAPDAAKFVIDRACILAEKENKNVLIIYHASWCSWCKRLDAVLNQKDVAPIMGKYYVITHLDVLEQTPEGKKLENLGGYDLMKAQGGETAGLPFLVIMNPKQKVLLNSMMKIADKEVNMGCPYEQVEIENFLMMLRKTAPKITEPEIRVVWSAFSALKRGDGG